MKFFPKHHTSISRIRSRWIPLVICLFLGACTTVPDPTIYPTFTPMGGFRILGMDTATPTPEAASNTPLPLPSATITPEPSQTAATAEIPLEPSTDALEKPIFTLVFTGQIVPGRCVQAETDRLGQADYLYDGVRDILSSANLTIGTLNASIIDFGLTTGCIETYLFVGRSIHAQAMSDAGFDVMSVASNHIKDCYLNNCEDLGFLATLENLEQAGIRPVGGGTSRTEALAPVYMDVSGIKIAFVSLGQLPPPTFAGEDGPGIGLLTEENIQSVISEAKAASDFVVFLPHWGPEYSHYPSASQVQFARAAVAAGADLIVGSHTQYIQAFAEIDSVPVYFGLGNFVFDQIAEAERRQSLLLRLTFQGNEIIYTEMFPTINQATGEVRIADQKDFVEILTNIQAISSIVQSEISE